MNGYIIWNQPGYVWDGFAIMFGLIIALEIAEMELDVFGSDGTKLPSSSSEI